MGTVPSAERGGLLGAGASGSACSAEVRRPVRSSVVCPVTLDQDPVVPGSSPLCPFTGRQPTLCPPTSVFFVTVMLSHQLPEKIL